MNSRFLIDREKDIDVYKCVRGMSAYTYIHFLPLREGLEAVISISTNKHILCPNRGF